MQTKFLITWLLLFLTIQTKAQLIVRTKYGLVQGRLVDNSYFAYEGIPFARPPVKDLRFKDPEPPVSWTGILNATRPGPVCPQAPGTFSEDQMSEDCLTLNVYVPVTDGIKPVMLWIHGGEFKSGTSWTHGPKFLMEKQDIVVVTTNYRIGALGFLCAKTSESPGNSGLKDLVMSLRWIQENIVSFAGNPKRVTISGESAGGVAAHYLMLTKLTDGLFKGAIFSSGPAIGFRFLSNTTQEDTRMLAAELGYDGPVNNKMITFLKTASTSDIVKAQDSMGKNAKLGFTPFAPFVPCVEDIAVSHEPFITDLPLTLIKEGVRQNVPVLAGFNAQEGIKMLPVILKNPKLIDEIDNDFVRCIPTDISMTLNADQKLELSEKIKRFYFGDRKFMDETIPIYVDLVTDSMFLHGIDHWLRIHSMRRNAKNVFYYMFDFNGELNYFKIANNLTCYPGTAHADDIGYLWDTAITAKINLSKGSPSEVMRQRIVRMWSDFVKSGDPTPCLSDLMQTKWNPINYPSINYLHLSKESEMRVDPLRNRTEFWEEIYVV